jgi:tetratricopeptide (TPR) repeat protein
MFKSEDISQITARGSQFEVIKQQIENYRTGFPYIKLTEAATNYHGIIKLSENEKFKYISFFEDKVSKGLKLLKFVPASGAASRMFKSVFAAAEDLKKRKTADEIIRNEEVALLLEGLDQFAFYEDLEDLAKQKNSSIKDMPIQELFENLLHQSGLNYGNLPKGLLKFHKYKDTSRTPLEEHVWEGALYTKDNQSVVNLHFTVSPEHQQLFENHVAEVKQKYEELFGVTYNITFSQQSPSTDVIAVTAANEPFRNNDGSLHFRPAGHGALLENLNELDADLIFIKNIDNIAPHQLNGPTIEYKKALAGVLLSLQEQIFRYQQILKEHHPNTLESGFYAEAANYLENVLHITPPQNLYYSEKDELYHYLVKKFNRPIRICGMVKNQGEPGGGPFFVKNSDHSVSPQIVESSQIDFNDPEQSAIAGKATHFNPVDLVCAVKNYKGEKYNLLEFRDPETGFISSKSKDGKELKVQELPGLWNGSMSDWNTLFVEVPIETFNPVKTVTDLLRKEHRTK